MEIKHENRRKRGGSSFTCLKMDSPELAELAGDAKQSPELTVNVGGHHGCSLSLPFPLFPCGVPSRTAWNSQMAANGGGSRGYSGLRCFTEHPHDAGHTLRLLTRPLSLTHELKVTEICWKRWWWWSFIGCRVVRKKNGKKFNSLGEDAACPKMWVCLQLGDWKITAPRWPPNPSRNLFRFWQF